MDSLELHSLTQENAIDLHSVIEFFDNDGDGWGKTYRSYQKISLSLYDLFPLFAIFMCSVCCKPKMRFMYSSKNTEHYRTVTALLHTHKTRLHLSPLCFQVQYTHQLSQTREWRLSLTQTTSKVNLQTPQSISVSCCVLSHTACDWCSVDKWPTHYASC